MVYQSLTSVHSFQTFVSYLHISTIVLGVLALIDFIFKFKRPIIFKICFAVLISSLLFLDILLWMNYSFADILKFSPFINFGIFGSGLFSLSILNSGKIEKWVWLSSILIFFININNYIGMSNIDTGKELNFTVFSLRFNDHSTLINITRFLQRAILLFSLFKLVNTLRANKSKNNFYQLKLIRWITLIIGSVFISVVLNMLISIFLYRNTAYLNYLFVVYNFICLAFFLLTIYRPSFLNNQDVTKFDLKKFKNNDALRLNDRNFYTPFFSNFYFLNKEANIEHFCKNNSIEEKELFNEQIFKLYQMNFSNLINKHRVEYFVEIVKNPKYAQFSVEGLALESGFNSRTALYKPFKKFHGGTPIDLIDFINS